MEAAFPSLQNSASFSKLCKEEEKKGFFETLYGSDKKGDKRFKTPAR
jgi:hypothetical protein